MHDLLLRNRHPRLPPVVEQHMEMWRRMILGIDPGRGGAKSGRQLAWSILVQLLHGAVSHHLQFDLPCPDPLNGSKHYAPLFESP